MAPVDRITFRFNLESFSVTLTPGSLPPDQLSSVAFGCRRCPVTLQHQPHPLPDVQLPIPVAHNVLREKAALPGGGREIVNVVDSRMFYFVTLSVLVNSLCHFIPFKIEPTIPPTTPPSTVSVRAW
jgi:hypothetical protein